MHERSSTAKRDLIALCVFATVALVVAVYFDAFENFERWARSYERWEIDELVVVPLVLALAFGFYAWRRGAELKKSDLRYRSVVDNVKEVIFQTDAEGLWTFLNPAWTEITGYSVEESIGTKVLPYLHPDDRQRNIERFRLLVERKQENFRHEIRYLTKDGGFRWIEAWAHLTFSDDGTLIGTSGTLNDITERKRVEDKATQQAALLEQTHDAVVTWQMDGGIVYWNEGAQRLYGWSKEEALGQNIHDLLNTIHPLPFDELVRKLQTEGHWEGELVHRTRGGRRIVVESRHVLGRYAGFPEFVLETNRDVTERRMLENLLEHQAFHDALTGLPNRAFFAPRVEHALARADRTGDEVAVLFVDIDDFKSVNDSLGHWAGDELLAEFARRLAASVRPGDTVARFGGDEFAVLLEGVTEECVAVEVAEQVIAELGRVPFVLGAREVLATPSIGVAVSGHVESGWEELLRRADLALHRAKEGGKAHCECFTPDLDERLRARLKLEGELRRALERGEFRVFYQPKVSIGSGEIVGMEALVRWEHPERGLLAPSEFLAVVEDTGLIVPIGEWVLRASCRQAKEWQERYPKDPPLAVSVNLSAKQFLRADLAEDIGAVLSECGLDPRGLTLEITESTAMEDAPATAEALRRLKVRGVRIEVDDFGTGYSSLSYLRRFPVDYLKVDRSFVAGLGQNPEDEGIVRAVVELARTLGLEVVAEGVETGEQLGMLREMGCGLAQGHYFWGALSAEAAGELLAAYHA